MPAKTPTAPKGAAGRRSGPRGAARKDAARQGGGHRLVIVESPAKARTIAGYLGADYVVESSIGHIRDMPDKAAEIPVKYRKEPWARLGVDVDHDFEALYVVHADKKSQVTKLKQALSGANELLLATDEDREGEAIAWHLLEELKPKIPTSRMVFHEITPQAIAEAVAHPRDLDLGLVDAYQTRRVLDRLYGYEVSPVLWKKVMPRLSAGRVQSVATRLVVARERERIAFRPAEYWDLEAVFTTVPAKADRSGAPAADRGTTQAHDEPSSFPARLSALDGRRIAQGRDFTPDGTLRAAAASQADRNGVPLVLDGDSAGALARRLEGAAFAVASVERKPYRRAPYAPFRTTTLQQEASRKLGYSAKYTMSTAQRLYENGHITYMRTDSVTLSQTAITAARAQARELYGAEYVPDAPRVYTSKVKNAQEAHEAIRPAGDRFKTPAQTGLSGDEFRLYELIWKRTVASQMKDATGESVSVRITGTSTDGRRGGVHRHRQDHLVPRLPEGLRGGRRGRRGARRPGAPAADARRADPLTGELTPASHVTRPRRATPRRAWSRTSRSGRSGARPRTPRSSARSSTAATCSRRAPRWSPRSWPSPWSPCSSSTSAAWSTTTSPRGWRRTSTRSPAARRPGCPGCAGSTSATERRGGPQGAGQRP